MTETTQKSKLLSPKNLMHDFVRLTGSPAYLWFRPKLYYTSDRARERIRGGALLIANHVGFVDPVLLLCAVPYRRQFFIVSEELMDKWSGVIFGGCRCIRVDRENPDMATFREIVARLKSGEVISMFPEGHITFDSDKPSAFKSGMVLMAVRSGVPIVPVYIRPKKTKHERQKIVIGERVSVRELYGERPTFAQLDAATKLLYEREKELAAFLTDQ